MALSLKTLFGAGPAKGRTEDEAEFDEPTTQVKMGKQHRLRSARCGVDHGANAHRESGSAPTRSVCGSSATCRSFANFRYWALCSCLFVLLALVMLFLNTRVSSAGQRQRNHRDRNADAFAAPRARDVACGAGQRARVRGRQGFPRPLPRRPRCADQGRQRQGREHRRHQQ